MAEIIQKINPAPTRTPMFDGAGNMSRPWLLWFAQILRLSVQSETISTIIATSLDAVDPPAAATPRGWLAPVDANNYELSNVKTITVGQSGDTLGSISIGQAADAFKSLLTANQLAFSRVGKSYIDQLGIGGSTLIRGSRVTTTDTDILEATVAAVLLGVPLVLSGLALDSQFSNYAGIRAGMKMLLGTLTYTAAAAAAVSSLVLEGNVLSFYIGTSSGAGNAAAQTLRLQASSTGLINCGGVRVNVSGAVSVSPGTPGTVALDGSPGGSVSGRLSFGADNTGWQFRISKNVAGVFTDYLTFLDNGGLTSAQPTTFGSTSTFTGAATFNGTATLNAAATFNSTATLNKGASLGLSTATQNGGGAITTSMYIPRLADMTGTYWLDYQDELAYIDQKAGVTLTVSPAPSSGTNSSIFRDDSNIIQWNAGATAGPLVITLDATTSPVTAKNNGTYLLGLTFRSSGGANVDPSNILVEVWNTGAGAYVSMFNGAPTLNGTGFATWMSPLFTSPETSPSLGISKLRVTISYAGLGASPWRLQRMILYHATAAWDPWHLSTGGGSVYGPVTVTGALTAASATVTAALSAGSASVTGALSAGSATVTGAAAFSAPDQISLGSGWLGWTPTVTAAGAMTVSGLSITDAQYLRLGPIVFFKIFATMTLGGTASSAVVLTLPVAMAGQSSTASGKVHQSGLNWAAGYVLLDSVNNQVRISPTLETNYALGSTLVLIEGFYRCS